jgi:hypothetical protein
MYSLPITIYPLLELIFENEPVTQEGTGAQPVAGQTVKVVVALQRLTVSSWNICITRNIEGWEKAAHLDSSYEKIRQGGGLRERSLSPIFDQPLN